MTMPLNRRMSVIIPTRNRGSSLKRLLDSLELATCPDGTAVEIIVINNHSTDSTPQILRQESTKERKYPIKILEHLKLGKAEALNLGLSETAGDLLLILDDDVLVDKFCLAQHVAAYKKSMFDAVQGRVLPGVDPDGRPADVSRLREYNIPLIDYGDAFCEIRGLTGTNMSIKREVYERVGSFDTRLGPGASGFSEDTEYSIRVGQAGFKIGYSPDAIVYHELNPERYGRSYNLNVQYRKGLSRSLYRHDSLWFRTVPGLIGNCLRYLIYSASGRRQKAYQTEGRIAKHCGYIAGKVQKQLLRHRRRP
ncbi:MAG: glycosyltransferase [Deltaproteobacteria bacterium]|nr:glycosyltransferase [Deltaproteobacteria bacterium]